jgi:hypothetical protein
LVAVFIVAIDLHVWNVDFAVVGSSATSTAAGLHARWIANG